MEFRAEVLARLVTSKPVKLTEGLSCDTKIACPIYYKSFTLIELLIIISIISLLIDLLLPALVGARAAAYMSQCGSNMRQLQMGTWLFAEDHDGKLFRHPDLKVTQTDRWDSNTVRVLRATVWDDISVIPYFNDNRNFFYCPGNQFWSAEKD